MTVLTKGNGQPLSVYDINSLSISGDGRYLTFNSLDDDIVPNDHNGVADTFVFDRVNHEFARVSLQNEGQEFLRDSQAVSIAADGHYVTFAVLGGGNSYTGYLTTNPFYGPEYCKGYTEFNAE